VLASLATACGNGDGKVSAASVRAAVSTPYETFAGDTTTLAAYAGRPVIVNFFASWCTPCVAEMPDFESVHQQFGDKVAFVGLNVDDRKQDAADLVARTKVSYDVGRDAGTKIFQKLGGRDMPTTVFLRADGTMADAHNGAIRRHDLVDKIRSELGVT
jgi:cytochrome c biogenesis protein CcmG, thiol:disulfide interchange protein DsbE